MKIAGERDDKVDGGDETYREKQEFLHQSSGNVVDE